jgi:hypothetical protein
MNVTAAQTRPTENILAWWMSLQLRNIQPWDLMTREAKYQRTFQYLDGSWKVLMMVYNTQNQ